MALSFKSYRRLGLGVAAIALAVPAAATGLYWLRDLETLELDAAVRAGSPGRFAALSDGVTHYDIAGPAAGPTLVLAAGFSVPYYIWDATFAGAAAAGRRVLRYDYYGRGLSDRPDVPYTQELYVRQLQELLTAAGVEGPIDLAGLSMGGAVVTSFAAAYPERVRSLIYVDAALRAKASQPAPDWEAWERQAVLSKEAGWADGQLEDFLHPGWFPEWPERYREQLRYRGFRRARWREITSTRDVDQQDELLEVGSHGLPVLLLWGRQDAVVPLARSERLLAAMPQARLVVIDEAGHLPQVEQPIAFNAALLQFLAAADHSD